MEEGGRDRLVTTWLKGYLFLANLGLALVDDDEYLYSHMIALQNILHNWRELSYVMSFVVENIFFNKREDSCVI